MPFYKPYKSRALIKNVSSYNAVLVYAQMDLHVLSETVQTHVVVKIVSKVILLILGFIKTVPTNVSVISNAKKHNVYWEIIVTLASAQINVDSPIVRNPFTHF